MSINKSYILEKLIAGYVKAPLPLKEQAVIKIALQLCQNVELKKEIFSFPQPTFRYPHYYHWDKDKIKQWEESIERQSSAVCNTLFLPRELKIKLIVHIRLIALQLLIWSTQHQELFDVSPDFTAHFLTSADWTAEGILNEKKIAERLVRDEGIPVYQRYRVACMYCLEPFILPLWDEISSQQRDFCASGGLHNIQELELVKLWSYHMAGKVNRLIGNEDLFWQYGFEEALKMGQKTVVVHCWEALNESIKQEIIIKAALDSAKIWKDRKNSPDSWLPLATHYIDILCFLLSQMCEEQRVAFFQEAFINRECILECFLEYPYQDLFVPIINMVWNILPELLYGELLFVVANKYAETKENQYYDYGGLLIEILARTPESYKRCMFHNLNRNSHSQAEMLLFTVSRKQPFDHRDLQILRCILEEATHEERLSIIYSESDTQICECLILNGNLELLNWVLKQCLPVETINDFKKHYFLSAKGRIYYSNLIIDGDVKQVNLFLEWGSLSTEEILQLNIEIFEAKFKPMCMHFITSFNLNTMDRIMKWCLHSTHARKQFKEDFIQEHGCSVCVDLLQQASWEELDKFLYWCLLSEEAVEKFKQEIFPAIATDVHYWFMCNNRWRDAALFFQWFHLSPKAIRQLKSDTLMSHDVFNNVYDMLFNEDDNQKIRLFFKWCFFDEQTVLAFKKKVEQKCKLRKITAKKLYVIQKVDYFVKEQLCYLASGEQHKKKRYYLRSKRMEGMSLYVEKVRRRRPDFSMYLPPGIIPYNDALI